MSFTIVLYESANEPNRVFKKFFSPSKSIMSLKGTLRDDTSIIDPVIIAECDLNKVINCNYIQITSFGRFYFVKNIRSIRQKLVEFTCHVDVLYSFRNEIGACDGVLRRSETLWNTYLNDGVFKIYQNPYVLTKSFPNGFNSLEMVLAVAGK